MPDLFEEWEHENLLHTTYMYYTILSKLTDRFHLAAPVVNVYMRA